MLRRNPLTGFFEEVPNPYEDVERAVGEDTEEPMGEVEEEPMGEVEEAPEEALKVKPKPLVAPKKVKK